MQCEEIRERFPELDSPPEHTQTCSACAEEWERHLLLRGFKAPLLSDSFAEGVLTALEERGFFESPTPTLAERMWEQFVRLLVPLALATCAFLFLWMGSLALQQPAPELRALQPDNAKLWSSLPDAVPAPPIPGPAPSREQMRLVKGGEIR
jgi:hypothetical protein